MEKYDKYAKRYWGHVHPGLTLIEYVPAENGTNPIHFGSEYHASDFSEAFRIYRLRLEVLRSSMPMLLDFFARAQGKKVFIPSAFMESMLRSVLEFDRDEICADMVEKGLDPSSVISLATQSKHEFSGVISSFNFVKALISGPVSDNAPKGGIPINLARVKTISSFDDSDVYIPKKLRHAILSKPNLPYKPDTPQWFNSFESDLGGKITPSNEVAWRTLTLAREVDAAFGIKGQDVPTLFAIDAKARMPYTLRYFPEPNGELSAQFVGRNPDELVESRDDWKESSLELAVERPRG